MDDIGRKESNIGKEGVVMSDDELKISGSESSEKIREVVDKIKDRATAILKNESVARKLNHGLSYRDEVKRTADFESTMLFAQRLIMGAMGLCGEAGEVSEVIKKHLFHFEYEKPLDRDRVIKELGDLRWYMEYLSIALDTTMEEIENVNVDKLRVRYPDGFSKEAAEDRVDTKEIAIGTKTCVSCRFGVESEDENGGFCTLHNRDLKKNDDDELEKPEWCKIEKVILKET